jgi:hypothetical protein
MNDRSEREEGRGEEGEGERKGARGRAREGEGEREFTIHHRIDCWPTPVATDRVFHAIPVINLIITSKSK